MAQNQEKDFVRYTVKDGLSDNNVSCLAQDDRGYMWIGTEIGLNRFDGHLFKNYYQGYPEHLFFSSDIRKIIKPDSNRLIISTANGFQLLNTLTGAYQNYFIPDSTPFVTQSNLNWDLRLLKDGTIAAASASGFYVFNPDGSLAFRHDAYGLNDIGIKRIFYGRNIFSVSDDQLLIYVEEMRLAYYQTDKKIFHELTEADVEWKPFMHPDVNCGGPWISKNQISDREYIFLPKADSIVYYNYTTKKRVASHLVFPWVVQLSYESRVYMQNDSTFIVNGGFTGFYLFHIDRMTGVISGGTTKFLNGYKINSIFQDKDHRLWVGTTQGLLRQILRTGMISSYDWPVGDLSVDGYQDGMRYKDKLYLCRYSRYTGLVIIDTSTMRIERQIHFYGEKNSWNEITSMQMYYTDTLWLGSSEGILWFDTKSNAYGKIDDLINHKIPLPHFHVLEPVRQDGSAWMCGILTGVVGRYDLDNRTFEIFTSKTEPALPFEKVKSIVYDAYGDVWIGGHSLARYNTQAHIFDTLITVYGGTNKYNDNILVMTADDEGSLWLHNNENGLLEYNIRSKEFTSYTMKDGLPSDVLRCFSPVIDHTLWIGSHNNLSRFNTRTKKIDVYGFRDGLPEQKPISRKIIEDHETDQMYMFYPDKVIRFPVHRVTLPEQGGELILEDLVINNQATFSFPGDNIRLGPAENNLSLNYTIINYDDTQNYQFAYKLDDADPWTSLGEQRKLNLNNLSPGSYTLQLSGTGRSGISKIKKFNFSIAAPYYKRSWFLASCMALVGSLVLLIYRSRIASFRQKANLDKLLSQTEMKALHAQMNPHFIFNSLNSIREMILNNENKEASRYLSKFAHLIRVTLDQSGQSFISLRNTIDYLERYIEMEKIRNVHFNCSITIDPGLELDETILPPMLIQPFIENAIWHGTGFDHNQIDIHVQFKKEKGQLICIVDDNGIGIERSLSRKSETERLHHSVGISNIKSRVQLLNKKHNLQSSISVEDKSGLGDHAASGTRVILKLPLEIVEE